MVDKKIIVGVLVCAGALCTLPFIFEDNSDSPIYETTHTNTVLPFDIKNTNTNNKINKNLDTKKQETAQTTDISKEITKKADLHKDLSANSLPLSVIAEIADLSKEVQDAVKHIAENSNGIFMAKKVGNKLFIVTDSPDNIRQGIDFVEISLSNCHQTRTTMGYNGKANESENDSWEYDTISDTKVPTRHTKYNKDGNIEFVETWNYDSSNPIKYEMKDDKGNLLSLRKETSANENDLSVQHLLYDEHGNTRVNVSASYEGADIKRFTYYNAYKPDESGSVFSEYTDGLKTKETVYNSELKTENIYTSEYKEGERTQISVFDSNNQEIEKIVE